MCTHTHTLKHSHMPTTCACTHTHTHTLSLSLSFTHIMPHKLQTSQLFPRILYFCDSHKPVHLAQNTQKASTPYVMFTQPPFSHAFTGFDQMDGKRHSGISHFRKMCTHTHTHMHTHAHTQIPAPVFPLHTHTHIIHILSNTHTHHATQTPNKPAPLPQNIVFLWQPQASPLSAEHTKSQYTVCNVHIATL